MRCKKGWRFGSRPVGTPQLNALCRSAVGFEFEPHCPIFTSCCNYAVALCCERVFLICRALRTVQANLTNPYNWYHGEISVPIAVGRACVLLDAMHSEVASAGGSPLPAALRSECAATMLHADWDNNPPGMTNVTGANLVWMGTARVYRGLLLANNTEVKVVSALGSFQKHHHRAPTLTVSWCDWCWH